MIDLVAGEKSPPEYTAFRRLKSNQLLNSMRSIKHDIHEELAIRLLGWKWITFTGVPCKGTPGYPEKCRVRQLFSKEQIDSKEWLNFFNTHDAEDSKGDEPLSYAYCSSRGPAVVPSFTILVDGM